jgi:hypothetical protein
MTSLGLPARDQALRPARRLTFRRQARPLQVIESPAGPAGHPGLPRWLPAALIGCGAAMLPWLAVLAVWLPSTTQVGHWSTAWVGLDAAEGAGLFLTGWLLRRGDQRACLAAAATAMALTIDAWFDVTTAAPGAGLALAVAMAAGAELPMAALCATLALRGVSGRRG